MPHEPMWECSFLIPFRRDAQRSDGEPHSSAAWEWLDNELGGKLRGRTIAQGLYEGFIRDPATNERVADQSRKYIVAASDAEVEQLRRLLTKACEVFEQTCIYFCVAGRVEFIERSACVVTSDEWRVASGGWRVTGRNECDPHGGPAP